MGVTSLAQFSSDVLLKMMTLLVDAVKREKVGSKSEERQIGNFAVGY